MCVGRVGGLAVALGIGMAVVTGTGCAVGSADTGDATASEQSTASPPAATAEPLPSQQPTPPPTTGETSQPATAPAPSSTPDHDTRTDAVQRRLPSLLTPKTVAPERKSDRQSSRVRPRASAVTVRPSSVVSPDASPALSVSASVSAPAPAPAPQTLAITEDLAPVPAPSADAPASAAAPTPVLTAISQAITRVVTGLLSAFGLDPVGPIGQTALWGLLAWTRRAGTTTTVQSAAQPAAATLLLPSAAVTPVVVSTQPVQWVTGAGLVGSYPVVPRTNDTSRMFGIWGTDLGIMWDNGIADDPATAVDEHQVLLLFGDTFSGPRMSGSWRPNVLLRSADGNLADGITVPAGVIGDEFSGSVLSGPNFAKQVIYSRPGTLGWLGREVTLIPTSGIALPYDNSDGARQYATVMSVKSWDTPGRWTTNYSAIAYSDDNGQTWTVAPGTVRSAGFLRTSNGYVSGNQNFQMNAFVTPPAGAADGYVYMYGTPSGRGGTIYLSRVGQANILDQTRYEYWTGTGWVLNKPSAAKPVLPATTSTSTSWFSWLFGGSRSSYPSAGEMSVQYNTYLNKYVMMYADSANNVVMRTADRPEGTWSAPVVVATSLQYPGLYAPMMHPWSTDQDIYWNMSMWGDYNVVLMHTVLA